MQTHSKIDDKQPFHIYYDISMINNDQLNGEPKEGLTYIETRNSAFLEKSENYFMSVVRFNMMTPSLPVFIPNVVVGQDIVNLTTYEIHMQKGTESRVSQNVIYIPSDKNISIPNPPITFQDLTNNYYFVYTVQDWINMVNETLSQVAVDSGYSANTVPFFVFDTNTSLMKLYIPSIYYADGTKIWFNNQLQTLFNTFRFDKVTIVNTFPAYSFTSNQLIYKSMPNNIVSFGSSIEYIECLQESTSLPLLNPVKSIVFTCSMLPLCPSLVNMPKIFGADSATFTHGNNSNISPILTDFEVNCSNANTYKNSIQYIPLGPYRLQDLYGQSPVNTLQISIFWKDIFDNLHPFILNSGCSCDIKIMFRRKDYNANLLL